MANQRMREALRVGSGAVNLAGHDLVPRENLIDMDPPYPDPSLDVAALKAQLASPR